MSAHTFVYCLNNRKEQFILKQAQALLWPRQLLPGVVARTFDPSMLRKKAREFQDSLGYIETLSIKKNDRCQGTHIPRLGCCEGACFGGDTHLEN